MCSCVTLEIKGVVEALSAECTEVALEVAVAFDVPVEKTLQWEHFLADLAHELVVGRLETCIFTEGMPCDFHTSLLNDTFI